MKYTIVLLRETELIRYDLGDCDDFYQAKSKYLEWQINNANEMVNSLPYLENENDEAWVI